MSNKKEEKIEDIVNVEPPKPQVDTEALLKEVEALRAEKAQRDAEDAMKAKQNDPSNIERPVAVFLTQPYGIKDSKKVVIINGEKFEIPYGEEATVPAYVASQLKDEQTMLKARSRKAAAGVVQTNRNITTLSSLNGR